MTEVLTETNFSFLGVKKTGKVRDLYEQPDFLVLITTDRHSSFDRIIAHIPWKGQVLNQVSAFWFEKTKHIVPNHVLAIPEFPDDKSVLGSGWNRESLINCRSRDSAAPRLPSANSAAARHKIASGNPGTMRSVRSAHSRAS